MDLKTLRLALKDGRAKLVDLRQKAFGATASDVDLKAYKDGLADCEKTLDQIKDAEREEALDAAGSKSADAPVGGDLPVSGTVYAEPERKMSADERISMCAAASAKSALLRKNGEDTNPLKILSQEGFAQFAKVLEGAQRQKAAVGAVVSTTNSSVLLPQPVTGDIIPFLRPETTFLQGNPKRVRLVGGKYRQPRGAGTSTAGYVGEGEKKPVGKPTFDGINMQAKKLAGIVYLTNEAAKWPVADIEAYIRDDLRKAIAIKMDSAMYFGTGSSNTPTGIFAQSGITSIAGGADGGTYFVLSKSPTVAELDRVARILMLSLTGNNIARNGRWRWTMGYRAWGYIADMRDGNGNALFPGMSLDQPVWKGIPVLVSNQFVENGGGATNEGSIGLVDFSHVLYGDEEDMIMKSTTEATIDDDGTLVHLWQQNMMAILAEIEHDVGVDQPKAIARLTAVRWGAL